ncbi:hypothetical protein K440DRAFT_378879 [Wilcoxina mikolae CBS 423.85]|nr:hypothetical protein K440DRAFT_378879 [Wilcoxina mikolae CBS 423.85]
MVGTAFGAVNSREEKTERFDWRSRSRCANRTRNSVPPESPGLITCWYGPTDTPPFPSLNRPSSETRPVWLTFVSSTVLRSLKVLSKAFPVASQRPDLSQDQPRPATLHTYLTGIQAKPPPMHDQTRSDSEII